MPFLFTENGPEAGKQFQLQSQAILIGRHPDCDIQVDVGAVSRHHAELQRIDGQYYVADLESRNGTYVNNTYLRGRHRLRQGDKIQVCDVTFRFGEEDEEPSSVVLVDRPNDSSVVMSRLDVLGSSGSVAIDATAESKLRALIEITRSLSRTLALEQLLPQVLDALFRLFIQADRGFIILRDERGELIPRWSKVRRGDDDRLIRLSRTILNQVVDGKQAILSSDTTDDQRFQLSESIADFRIRSFICAPLVDANGNVLGAIQLDSLDNRNRFRQEDVEMLASVAGQAAIALDNAQLHEQVVRQQLLERDLQLAQQVQRGFLPKQSPESRQYKLRHFYQPADMVGGDYFDYVSLPDGRVAVVVADVVGHGMAAALQTAQLSSALRFSLATCPDPAMAIRELNRSLSEGSLEDRFITLEMLVLHPGEDRVTIVNAGHTPPMLCREGAMPIDVGGDVRGVPLLVLEPYEYESFEMSLQPGDHILMYTDGLNEAMNKAGQLYGIERLRKRVRSIVDGEQFIKRLIEDIHHFADGAPQNDDMCLVCCTKRA